VRYAAPTSASILPATAADVLGRLGFVASMLRSAASRVLPVCHAAAAAPPSNAMAAPSATHKPISAAALPLQPSHAIAKFPWLYLLLA